MLKIRVRNVSVILDTLDPDEPVRVRYRGDREEIERLRYWIGQQYDAYGHFVCPDRASPRQMVWILQQIRDAEILSGADIVTDLPPPLPYRATT